MNLSLNLILENLNSITRHLFQSKQLVIYKLDQSSFFYKYLTELCDLFHTL
uniref:Uncharacterized protein n=1 Tax=Rhizophora mucronata TaxID=61149 RepID=A0A2P2NWS1_RHIMU